MAAHPGLFSATGFAHHPYAFFLAPTASMSDANFVPLSDISRLEHALDAIFATYGVHRQLPIYVTEYGYETNPPNPFRGVSPVKQAAYLNQAQYLAWKDPRIRTMAQFLLADSPPDPRYTKGSIGYWSTFQTGLLFVNGVPKPSFASYQLPIDIPVKTFHAGAKVFVWGMLRAAPNDTTQHAQLQWRPPRGLVQDGRPADHERSERLPDRPGIPARDRLGQARVDEPGQQDARQSPGVGPPDRLSLSPRPSAASR